MVGSCIRLLSLLALALHRGEAIRCVVCSSSRDSGCKDPLDRTHVSLAPKLTECTQDNMRNIGDVLPGIYSSFGYQTANPQDFVCVKAVTREYDRDVVIRSCTIPRTDTFDVCSQLKSKHLTYCETCNTDSCNGALGLAPGSLLFSLLPVTALSLIIAKY